MQSRPLRLGLIGCGYWGPNLVRTFLEMPEVSLELIADRDPDRLDRIRSRAPLVGVLTTDHRRAFESDLDAVVISTPPETHFEIAREALLEGLDVFVEKPLATRSDEALELTEMADDLGRVLMVGHIGAYNPAVQALRTTIRAGELGQIRYIDAIRVGLGLFHPRLNVIWDLAPHDISILLYLLDEAPTTVSAHGIACIEESVEDLAYLTMRFASGILAHVRLSWLDPSKTRRVTVVGSRRMAIYDDLEPHEKIKIYDKRVSSIRPSETYADFQFAYHYGSVVSPYVELEEPLRSECSHFVECVLERTRPITDGRNGVRVVRTIEAAQRSLRKAGVEVPVADEEPSLRELPDPASNRGLAHLPSLVPLRVAPEGEGGSVLELPTDVPTRTGAARGVTSELTGSGPEAG
jgi:predicted dehydrogenase